MLNFQQYTQRNSEQEKEVPWYKFYIMLKVHLLQQISLEYRILDHNSSLLDPYSYVQSLLSNTTQAMMRERENHYLWESQTDYRKLHSRQAKRQSEGTYLSSVLC